MNLSAELGDGHLAQTGAVKHAENTQIRCGQRTSDPSLCAASPRMSG